MPADRITAVSVRPEAQALDASSAFIAASRAPDAALSGSVPAPLPPESAGPPLPISSMKRDGSHGDHLHLPCGRFSQCVTCRLRWRARDADDTSAAALPRSSPDPATAVRQEALLDADQEDVLCTS